LRILRKEPKIGRRGGILRDKGKITKMKMGGQQQNSGREVER